MIWKRRYFVTQQDLDTLVSQVLGLEPRTLHLLDNQPLYYTKHNLRSKDKLLKCHVVAETTGSILHISI